MQDLVTMVLQELVKLAAETIITGLAYHFTKKIFEELSNRDNDPKNIGKNKIKIISKRLGRRIHTNYYEEIIASDIINLDNIDVEFDSIGGLETKKKDLYELTILPLHRPELFLQGKLSTPQKGILLYGPPGTGKTMLAKAIARETRAVFINVKISNLLSKWLGQSEKIAAAIFSLAYKLQPAIIFIDEVDSLLGQQNEMDYETFANIKKEFMVSWDGLSTDPNARILVLAATNHPAVLDAAILRRFPEAFEIGLPGQRERADILRRILKGEKVEKFIDFDYIAGLCDGYSGSDLFHLCKKAVKYPIRDLLIAEKIGDGELCTEPRALSQKDLEKVLETSITTVSAIQYNGLPRNSLTYYI